MRLRHVVFSVLCLASTLALARCAGCSEECSGENQGAEGCPCGSDQDCTTRLGAILLCVEGACEAGDPPDAPGTDGACTTDDDCGAGQACGVDDICLAAPACQRIEAGLQYRLDLDTTGNVTNAVDGCVHTWTVDEPALGPWEASFTIALDGTMTFQGESPCTQGRWFAGRRLGAVRCEGLIWAVGPPDVVAKACVAQDCGPACQDLGDGDGVGVCP